MDEGHTPDSLGPLRPVRVVDEANEVHQKLTENWLGLITGADGRDHRVHVDFVTRTPTKCGPMIAPHGRTLSHGLRPNVVQ